MRVTRKRIIGGAVAFGAAFLMSVAAFAQHGPEGHGGHRGPHGPGGPGSRGGGHLLEHFSRALDLTDAQKAQIKQLADASQESNKALFEKLRSLGRPEDAALTGTFDEAAVRSAAQARAAAQVELEVAHARLAAQVYNVLTAEQKAKLAELRQQFETRRRQWDAQRGDGAAPPPPPVQF